MLHFVSPFLGPWKREITGKGEGKSHKVNIWLYKKAVKRSFSFLLTPSDLEKAENY